MLQESKNPQSTPASPAAAPTRNRMGVAIPAVQPLQKKRDSHQEDEPAQMKVRSDEPARASAKPFQLKANNSGLPDQLKTGIENLSGFSMDDVKVHYNSDKPAQLQAFAYAQGNDIHIGPGQEKHLPHEAWHVVQQKQGRVSANLQMKGAMINDDPSLESEADIMGEKAVALNDAGTPLSMKQQTTGSSVIQAKKEIKGAHNFPKKGKLSIHFEEMRKGSSVGMYGYISFYPLSGGYTAYKIELVQIASLRTNDNEQAKYMERLMPKSDEGKEKKEEASPEIKETNLETEGENPVKNMVRNASPQQHFIDLLYTHTKPREQAGEPNVEMAYNAERRGKWDDPLDTIQMGKTDTVRNFYNLLHQKPGADAEVIKIDQFPGYNDGPEEIKETALHDFPVSGKPSVFSFQTSVDVDPDKAGKYPKEYWGVVKWGFTTLVNPFEEEAFIDQVAPVEFTEGNTPELKASRENFASIFANSSAWTSPEGIADIDKLLKAGSPKGIDYLENAAKDFNFVLGRILDESKSDPDVLKRIAGPHQKNVSWILLKLKEKGLDKKEFSVSLSDRYKQLYA
ncbi:DUF4157 domain-containing protein [Chitinophaga eiseniae]|uniref:DUF4157 domain-containing protein n=1 Tax=Chitinophaga eiseniae TaxID=634771 RepID=A0A847SMZ6_9BACT|nr:DUF4157 domain-containing protein [Chitinophaga eiseniae]NLR77332.1 DUF4157 domain-containing protein [Chitinophaga eiseniae]